MDTNVVLAGVFAFAVLLVFIGIDSVVHSSTSVTADRLGRYTLRSAPPEQAQAGQKRLGDSVKGLGRLAASSNLATDLARADLKLTPGEYVLINLAATVLGYVIALVIFRGNLIVAIVGAIAGFYAPRWYVRHLQAKRQQAFNDQLPDCITLLANSLRSGYSLLQAMDTGAKEMPAPISIELGRVTREIGLGLSVQEALANMLRRIPSDDLDLLVTAINVQHEVGGNLSEILDTIAFTIRERIRIQGEVRVITSQQRLSGNVLALLPVVLGLAMYAINPGYIQGLWGEVCGWVMMGVGGTAVVVGYFAIRAIATVEV